MPDLYANWARVYDWFYPLRSDEVACWQRLAGPRGRCVLDLMCGTAEVSLGLARQGFRVLGVDLSLAMLRQGAIRLAAAADHPARSLSIVQGDARHIPVGSGFADFALVGGNGSFNHLDDTGARASLAELYRTLRPGGGLGLELVNPHLLQEIYPQRSFAPFRPTPPGVSVVKTLSNRYDRQAGLFHIHQVTRYEIAGESGQFEESFALRIWQPEEARSLLEGAGFQGLHFYGGHNLKAFGHWSSDLLLVAEKPETA